jgi:hypothetical protein
MIPSQAQTTKVSFDKLVIKGIQCDFSPEEIESYWWTSEDFAAMRRRDSKLHKLVKLGNPTGRKLATDGLVLDEPKLERKERVRSVMMAVFTEQEAQWALGIHDPDSLAAACRDQNLVSRRVARKRGLTALQETLASNLPAANRALRIDPTNELVEKTTAPIEVDHPIQSIKSTVEFQKLNLCTLSPIRRRAPVGRLLRLRDQITIASD